MRLAKGNRKKGRPVGIRPWFSLNISTYVPTVQSVPGKGIVCNCNSSQGRVIEVGDAASLTDCARFQLGDVDSVLRM